MAPGRARALISKVLCINWESKPCNDDDDYDDNRSRPTPDTPPHDRRTCRLCTSRQVED
jgi:hypothetical protein